MRARVCHNAQGKKTALGPGVSRNVLSHDPRMMVCEIRCEAGAEGPVHAHPHAQSTYVASGRFRFLVDDARVNLGPGDSITIEPDVPHGTLCLEAGLQIDVFTPMRADFI